jgi:hypothetical protein
MTADSGLSDGFLLDDAFAAWALGDGALASKWMILFR